MGENQKSSKLPIIAALVVIVILLIIGGCYLHTAQKPKNIFTKAIEQSLTSSQKENVKNINSTIEVSANINAEDKDVKEIAEYINKVAIKANVQLDLEDEKEIVKLGLDYDSENLLDATAYYKNQEDNIYVFVTDLFDKYFSAELDDDTKSELAEIFEKGKDVVSNSNDVKEVSEILNEKISNRLKEEYFSQEKAKIEINGKKVNTKKSTLTLTETQLKEVAEGLINDLASDEKFLSYLDDDTKNLLTEMKESIDEEDVDDEDETTEDAIFKINIYTKGLTSSGVKVEVVVSENDQEYTVSITKDDDENYEVYANIPEVAEINVSLKLSTKINKGIEDIDVSDSVNVDELSDEDLEKIESNLQNMKIYKIVTEAIQKAFSSSYDDEDYSYDDDEDDYDVWEDNELEEEVY